ncbi:MAG: hypothetical protein KF678_12870 [Phycisphaeraceae bacterium]|nr:hypothetical protein [Phycisphaeraceae bacterium]
MLPTTICTLAASFEGVNLMWIVFGGVFVTAILAKSIKSVVTSNARERSRREIAAYIAEGSMTPEQGERLMRAGNVKEED